ncbi:DUF815 domain-containing protein [Parerythrobacter jejuensis]|uniref:DUF815 domain-containing protein n=1 Tax=Parerythrobacter jejuensis TaxID=795812 RepID=UPI0018F8B951|nr:DUF815 domain-containing protein [Parerythrobacter jejuensis]
MARIADALERLSPPHIDPDWSAYPAHFWNGHTTRGLARIEAPTLEQLRGIDRQKSVVTSNVARHAQGHAAHDMLLWGSRGMGKSALIRAAVISSQSSGHPLVLVQASNASLDRLPRLFDALGQVERQFIVLLDDIGFAVADRHELRQLRSFLEGGIEPRPANIRLAVTTNQRAIVERSASEQSGSLHERDTLDDSLALADRFGLSVGFHACSQAEYLEIISAYADPLELTYDTGSALEWVRQRGAQSGRTAWQYVVELAGRAGRTL